MVDSVLNEAWRLTVRSEFSAAHALRHYKGKCERLHGHNFAVELLVEGNILNQHTGMLVDFAILKNALAQILEKLDHCVLNETPPFDVQNPSSELLACHIGTRAIEVLKSCPEAANVRVYGVSVSEKSTQSALWLAPGGMIRK